MIITHQKGRGNKIHLLIDDAYCITTDADFWAEHYIQDGTELTEEELDALISKINYRKAINKAVDLLSHRDHSVKELRDKLIRTADVHSADMAIEKMLALGYLDDEKYANILIKHLLESKRFSVSHVRQECYKRGIDRDIVQNVLDMYAPDNVANAVQLIETKYALKLQQENGREKVTAALMRKGFSYSDIKSAFYRIENEDYV